MKENKIEKLILDLSNRWDCSPQEAVDRLNSMNESEINKLINSMTKKFKNGGFIDCLRGGGSVDKCKCGCDKIAKAQGGLPELRQRGVTPAYRGSYPEFNEADSTWVRTPDGYMKNTFSGNTLEQNLVTYDEGWVPRRSVRRITNYDIPAQADTSYRDARGLWSSRNPSWLAKLTGNVHSTRFMDNVDSNLEGFEPAQLNEREVRKTQKKAYGGSIKKAQDGTKVGSATYQIKKGDNLIKIARQFGLNSLDEILSLNPQIKNPNMIYEGQVLNLPKDKMSQNGKLDAASVSDKMPNYDQVAYAELPESVRAKVDAYASAINDHKIKYTDVPALYRQQAYNQSIRQDTNNAAPMIATKALMAPWTIPDTVIRGGLNEARKLVNGKDDSGDYGVGDYFDGNFSWLGKKHQEEHPVADAVINAVTTPIVMTGAENVAARAMDGTLSGTMARASANAKATARTMGVQPEPITVEYTMGKTGGHSYKGPGAGRAHTRGGVNNASYRQVPVSSKVVDPMNFVENPAASGFTGTGYWHGFPAVLPEQEKPNYVMVEPEKEYMEETIVSPNKWIYDTRTPDVVVPYALGDETITYTKGSANRGRSPEEQAIMKESIETGQGNPKPGVKLKKGEATGSTPSGYYSGFGYTYGTEGGPWLTYQQKGGILNKYKKK